jgi:hypothetical protein
MVDGMPAWADPENLVVVQELEPRITASSALAFLQAVYKNPDLPLPTRIRCAGMALPFESPKLTAIANLTPEEFSVRLEKAIARSGVTYLASKADPKPWPPPIPPRRQFE